MPKSMSLGWPQEKYLCGDTLYVQADFISADTITIEIAEPLQLVETFRDVPWEKLRAVPITVVGTSSAPPSIVWPAAVEEGSPADPAQLRQALDNILRNAAQAMPKGGTIDIDMRAVVVRKSCRLHAGKYVKVSTAGEPFNAFLPAPLPPEPPVVWSPALRRRFDDALLASAKCTNEENYLFNKFTRQILATNTIDHCARL